MREDLQACKLVETAYNRNSYLFRSKTLLSQFAMEEKEGTRKGSVIGARETERNRTRISGFPPRETDRQ